MKGFRVSAIAGAIVAAASAGNAMAADQGTVLANVQSPVMVNQGEAYVPATAGMTLHEGDQLMVLSGGAAQVNFATGCQLELGGNEMLRVSQDACNTPAAAGVNAQLAPGAAGGGGGAAAGGANLVGLGLTLGAIGYAGYEISDDDNDNNQQSISQ